MNYGSVRYFGVLPELSSVFFLVNGNLNFVTGQSQSIATPPNWLRHGFRKVTWGVLVVAIVSTVVGAGMYLNHRAAVAKLLGSIITTQAKVLGCESRGQYQALARFTFNGKVQENPFRMAFGDKIPRGGWEKACAEGVVQINFLSFDANAWAFAPISPVRRVHEIPDVPIEYYVVPPTLWFMAGVWGLVCWSFLRREGVETRLNHEGKLVRAEVVRVKVHEWADPGESSANTTCQYAFTDPMGVRVEGKRSVFIPGISKKTAPLPGTPMLVLYVDGTLHEAL